MARTQSWICGQVALRDAEPPAHRLDLQQAQHLLRPEAALRDFQQREEGSYHRALRPLTAIRDAEGNPPVRLRGAEDCLDERGVGLDVRGHDGDIPRLEPWVRLEQGQELIVEDLHLAHGAVTGVDLDRTVIGAEAGAGSAVLPPVPQGEDVGLETVEQGVLAGLLELPQLVRVVIQEQPEEIPPLLAAGGQQAVAGL